MILIPPTLRYALRLLAKNPGSTAVAVVALAFGIGANTAMYSAADILLYHPIVVPQLDRVVTVITFPKGVRKSYEQVSPADFLDWKAQIKTIEDLSAVVDVNLNLTGDGAPARLAGARSSAGFFRALGAQPMLGRTFIEGEDVPGQDRVAVLGYGLWTGRFASDPNVLNSAIQLEGQTYRVIGVMAKDFRYPPTADLWIPLAMDANERNLRTSNYLHVVGRLKSGVSVSTANSEIETLEQRISERYPEFHGARGAHVNLLREYVSGDYVADFARMLLGSVMFVLLIACSNVANLQFARVSLRSKEIAVRSALGASRLRLIVQVLTESAILGILGALLGLLLAAWGLHLMGPAIPPEVQKLLPGWSRLGINGHVLLFTAAAAFFASMIAGIAPAWIGSLTDLHETLKETGRASGGIRRHRILNLLVAGQIVLALVLLVGAGLIAKGSRLVTEPAPGIDPAKALSMRISLPESKYASQSQMAAFEERLLRSLQSMPGATAAAIVTNLPYSSWSSAKSYFTIESRDVRENDTPPTAQSQAISPDYFRALHLPILQGRAFADSDGKDATRVAIISQTLAARFFPGESPIGKRLKAELPSADAPWMTIVGVVANVRVTPFDKFYKPVLYRPYQQATSRSFDLLIRTSADPKAQAATARAQVAAIDRDQPVYQLKTLEELFNDQLSGFRFLSVMMDVFGFLALFLAGIGVYAVVAFSVNERTHEIGVRMALGARDVDVLWMIVRRSLAITGSGLLIGLPATLALGRLLARILFGVNEYDPATFTTGLVVLAGAAVIASWIPARRAAQVDPMIALRTQ